MATDKEKKEILINYIKRNVFNPILRTSEEEYSSEKKKKKLREVQKITAGEMEEITQFKSAKDVRDNYLNNLQEGTSRLKNRTLSDLKLPALSDLKDDFMKLCTKLNI